MITEEKGDRTGMPSTLAETIEAVAKELKALAGTVRKVEKSQVALSKAVPALEQLRKVAANAATLDARATEAIARLTEGQEKGWLELEARIKDLCERRRWRVDGSWPSFMVDYGVQVNIDEKARVIHIGSAKVAGANMEAIEAELAHRVAALIPRDYAPERFVEELFGAYQDAKRSTAQVPVQDIYRSLVVRTQRSEFWKSAQKERFVEITIEQFRARLCRALEKNVVRTKGGSELRLYPPLDAKEGLFMFSPVDRRLGFVGRVEFTVGA